jgi:hypothetical protein
VRRQQPPPRNLRTISFTESPRRRAFEDHSVSSTLHAATTRALHQMQYPRFHEAAHALADRRGVKDTSRQGRYHTRRFKALAEALGLSVEHHPTLGWSPTTLPDRTAGQYSDVLGAMERALTCTAMASRPRPDARATRRRACAPAAGGSGSRRRCSRWAR